MKLCHFFGTVSIMRDIAFHKVTLGFLSREHARTQKIWMIFQPFLTFLLHKNEQGGHPI